MRQNESGANKGLSVCINDIFLFSFSEEKKCDIFNRACKCTLTSLVKR